MEGPALTLVADTSGLQLWDGVALAAYMTMIVAVGIWAGRFCRGTDDFFFGGRRFGWLLVAVSCIATLVGSYSFLQYSELGFRYGLCSMYQYTNEWFVLPLFLFAWLPITYYGRIQSIPEYFEKRFDARTRLAVLVILLIYLEVYIGINLLTIGRALHGVFDLSALLHMQTGWSLFETSTTDIVLWATLMAVVCAFYLHAGGQTSVIITDLFQGLLLLVVGLAVFFLGIQKLGGWQPFWAGLPETHRLPFAQFNRPAAFPAVGTFWDDAMVGTFAFYIINQGVLMRFLSAKSVRDARKAMIVVVIVLMPLVAVSVSGAGWVGRALATHRQVPFQHVAELEQQLAQPAGQQQRAELETQYRDLTGRVFMDVARAVTRPGLFGLVVAAVVAALMSTLDTLITAVSAIAVNDIWRKVQPHRDDRYYLRTARHTATGVTILGLLLIVPLNQYQTIYQALTAFTSLILPPLIVVTAFGILWRRFSARAAFWTLILGSAAMLLSWKGLFPQLITPLAHGVEMDPARPYVYMRACYGLIVSTALALMLSCWDRRPSGRLLAGLVVSSLDEARRAYKGGEPNDQGAGRRIHLRLACNAKVSEDEIGLPLEARLRLQAEPGDLVFVADARPWLRPFRSFHAKVAATEDSCAVVSATAAHRAALCPGSGVVVEKIM